MKRRHLTQRVDEVLGQAAGDGAEPAPGAEILEVEHGDMGRIGDGRGAYVYLIDGMAAFDGEAVTTGDAAKVTDQASVTIRADEPSELILVDVPLRFEAVGIWAGRV